MSKPYPAARGAQHRTDLRARVKPGWGAQERGAKFTFFFGKLLKGPTRMSTAVPTVKVLLAGNGSVGKSSIINRLVTDGFGQIYKQTIGCDFFERHLTLKGDHRVVLQVWDIGGQSIASQMFTSYIHGASIICFCYDVTDAQSFADLDDWFMRVSEKFSTEKSKPDLYLLGNKVDLIGLRQVSEKRHAAWIDRQDDVKGGFFVSARSGENILRVFHAVTAKHLGIVLTDYDLEFLDRVLVAEGVKGGDDEGRTSIADQIEAEDRALEEAKRRRQGGACQCALS